MGIINTDELRQYGARYESEVAAKLYAANQTLAKASQIEYSNFTTLHPPLAITYVEAFNFQHTDLEQKGEAAQDIQVNIRASADAWDAAEDKNTMNPNGGG